jgi:spore maturation protein SpmA
MLMILRRTSKLAFALASKWASLIQWPPIGEGELGVSEIARKVGAVELLVSRVMKLLAAIGLFKEVAENKYANGPLAPAFSDASPLPKAVTHMYVSEIEI